MRFFRNLKLSKKLFILGIIPFLGIMFFSFELLTKQWSVNKEFHKYEELFKLATIVSKYIHESQKERGMTAGFLVAHGKVFGRELPEQRISTDQRLVVMKEFLNNFDSGSYGRKMESALLAAGSDLAVLEEVRFRVDQQSIGGEEALAYYTSIHDKYLDVINLISGFAPEQEMYAMVAAYSNLLYAKESAGVERAILTNTFVNNKFLEGYQRRFLALMGEQKTYIGKFLSCSHE